MQGSIDIFFTTLRVKIFLVFIISYIDHRKQD